MTSSLSKELNKFFRHSQRLRAILEETKQCFEEINSSGKYDGAQIVTAELLREEEAEVLATVEKPPALIIIGQTAYAKSRIINEIFGQTIYPILDDTDDDKSFRMVRFKHGDTSCFSLTLDEFDVVDTLEAYNGPFNIIPKKYLETTNGIVRHDNAHELATLEVTLNHPLLNYDCQVIIFPSNLNNTPEDLMKKLMETFTPILVYGFLSTGLSEEEKKELKEIRKITDHLPCFFVQCPDPGSEGTDTDPPDGTPSSSSNQILRIALQVDKHISNISSKQLTKRKHSQDAQCSDSEQKVHLSDNGLNKVYQLLGDVGYFPDDARINNMTLPDYREPESEFLLTFEDFPKRFSQFTQKMLQCYLINSATILNNSHSRCINMFIMSAFDMARDMMITPKKLEFARSKEEELYKSLLQITISKHDEIKSIIIDTIKSMHDEILLKALEYDFIGVDFDETGKILTAKGLKICTWQIQEFLLSQLNRIIAGKLVNSINVMRDSYTGTLTRCLESLESTDEESPDSNKTTDALKQILNAAYQVEITITSSSSLIRVLLEKMRQFVQSLPWKTPPRIDDDWKKKMASETLSSLSEARLAKSISSQIKERLNKSHEAFGLALKQLDLRHTGRLDKIEEERLKLRKYHAPKVAKLALESTSLKDVILHGMPQIGKEVGRGQYGVVYSCDNWAGFSPCAIKSVVPPDDKHWNDLAMEFYYTRHVPDHDRIVSLRGSVIDYNYGGGSTPAVLLVMERLQKDLYTAIKLGLDWPSRLQVAIDVEEGIRFLHSRGLVHRDIKLKNVLLDRDNRGKITDLGFCKPEAMMSGSIVGTPIHMAPELFSGRYDNSVDVYAFGILFWYVCAGSVKLPQTFEQCANKDQLWTSVKKGLRPEKLSVFDEECWKLMECCWQGEPARRPLLGDVELALKSISKRFPSLPPNKVAASGQKVGASTPRDIKNIVGRFSQRT